MLPIEKPRHTYRTLEEIRQRKDALLDEMQKDNQQFTDIWSQLFVKQEESTRSEYIMGLVNNSMTIIDLFLLYRKIRKNYGSFLKFFGREKR